MSDDVSIGKNLATLRVSAHLTQGDLAERIGVAQQTIAKVEKGARPLKHTEAIAICAVLNAPISALSADSSKVDTTARLIGLMASLNGSDSSIQRVAGHMGPNLVKLAFTLSAIKAGRLDPPADWDSEQARAMAFITTDWGSEILNWALTRSVRQKCFELGFLEEVDANSYQEILMNSVEWNPDSKEVAADGPEA
ncbi:helix-turn-helix transcriptional regulator [Mycobacteroides abscessus]|uniref:helix-turn-helix transcriptional regulator n=1 Tax=Mycobacteroides abscessus TaxID=36809 RepID=UPI000E6A3FA6|nr:helix-turn-helix transcriptional regulator [Mycobacteroides abscessus]RIU38541.1 XRE family transcriptional regulator [Mycobacteroides abscessus]